MDSPPVLFSQLTNRSTSQNIRELANELDLWPELIYKWRRQYKESPERTFPGKGVETLTPQEKKLRGLQKENNELRMERNILKEACG